MSSNNKPICVNHGKWTFPILGCMSCWKGCHWAYESADIVSLEFVSTWIMRITPLKYSWGEQKSIRRLFIKTSCSISAWRPAPCIVPLDFLGMLFFPPPLRSPLHSPQVLEPTHLWLMATAAHVWAGQGPPEPCAALCPPCCIHCWGSAGALQCANLKSALRKTEGCFSLKWAVSEHLCQPACMKWNSGVVSTQPNWIYLQVLKAWVVLGL